MTTLTPAISILVALIAAAVSAGTYLSQRRKTAADTDSTTVATALSLLPAMRQQIEMLEARTLELEARDRVKATRIDELESGIQVLTHQIHELGDSPRWPPILAVKRSNQHDGD